MLRSFHHRDFPAERLLDAKRGRSITVCLPARNEEATVGRVVEVIRRELIERHPLVDQLLVIDDGSVDATAATAAAAGADVVSASEVLPEHGIGGGKGEALWRGVHAASGDAVVFCDADIRNFTASFILGMVGPLLVRDDVSFVKAFYERPLDGRPGEGGRVTELVARPLISMFFPYLAPLVQPLAGECAAWRDVLEQVPFVGGYGVDLGLLIDVARRFGAGSIVQCDLGERVHRNRPLHELAPQAMAIMQLALNRAGVGRLGADTLEALLGTEPWSSRLLIPGGGEENVAYRERPPLRDVAARRKTA